MSNFQSGETPMPQEIDTSMDQDMDAPVGQEMDAPRPQEIDTSMDQEMDAPTEEEMDAPATSQFDTGMENSDAVLASFSPLQGFEVDPQIEKLAEDEEFNAMMEYINESGLLPDQATQMPTSTSDQRNPGSQMGFAEGASSSSAPTGPAQTTPTFDFPSAVPVVQQNPNTQIGNAEGSSVAPTFTFNVPSAAGNMFAGISAQGSRDQLLSITSNEFSVREEQLRRENADLVKRLRAALAQCENAEGELKAQRRAIREAAEKLRLLEHELGTVTSRLAVVEKELDTTKSQLVIKERQISHLQTKIEKEETEKEKLQEKLDDFELDTTGRDPEPDPEDRRKIERLEAELAHIRPELEVTRGRLPLTAALRQKNERIFMLEAVNERLEHLLHSREQDNTGLSQELEVVEGKLWEKERECNDAQEAQLIRTRALDDLNNIHRDLTTKYKRLQAQHQQLQAAQIETRNRHNKTVNALIEEAKQFESRIPPLEFRLHKETAEKKELQEKYESQTRHYELLEAEKDALMVQVQLQEKEKGEAGNQSKRFEAEKQKIIAEAQKEIEAARLERDLFGGDRIAMEMNLNKQLAAKDKTIAQHAEQMKALRTEFNEHFEKEAAAMRAAQQERDANWQKSFEDNYKVQLVEKERFLAEYNARMQSLQAETAEHAAKTAAATMALEQERATLAERTQIFEQKFQEFQATERERNALTEKIKLFEQKFAEFQATEQERDALLEKTKLLERTLEKFRAMEPERDAVIEITKELEKKSADLQAMGQERDTLIEKIKVLEKKSAEVQATEQERVELVEKTKLLEKRLEEYQAMEQERNALIEKTKLFEKKSAEIQATEQERDALIKKTKFFEKKLERFEAMEQERSALIEKTELLENKLEEFKALEQERDSLIEKVQLFEQEVKKYQEIEEERNQLLARRELFEQNVAEFGERLQEMLAIEEERRALIEKNKQIEQRLDELQTVEQERDAVIERNKQSEQRLEALQAMEQERNALLERNKESDQRLRELQAVHQQTVERMTAERQGLEEQIADRDALVEQRNSAVAEAKSLRNAMTELHKSHDAKLAEMQHAEAKRSKAYQGFIEEVEQAKAIHAADVIARDSHIKDIQKDRESLKKQNTELKSRYDLQQKTSTAVVSVLKGERDSLSTENAELQKQLKEQTKGSQSGKIKALQKECKALTEQKAELEKRLKEQSKASDPATVEALQTECRTLSEEKAELEKRLKELSEAFEPENFEALKECTSLREVKSEQLEKASESEALNTLKERKTHLSSKLHEMAAAKSAATKALKRERASFLREKAQLESELERSGAEAEGKIRALRREVDSLRQQSSSDLERIERLKESLAADAGHLQTVEALKRDLAEANAKLRQAEDASRGVQGELGQAEAQQGGEEVVVGELNEELSTVQTDLDGTLGQFAGSQRDLAKTKVALVKAKDKVSDLRKEVVGLRDEQAHRQEGGEEPDGLRTFLEGFVRGPSKVKEEPGSPDPNQTSRGPTEDPAHQTPVEATTSTSRPQRPTHVPGCFPADGEDEGLAGSRPDRRLAGARPPTARAQHGRLYPMATALFLLGTLLLAGFWATLLTERAQWLAANELTRQRVIALRDGAGPVVGQPLGLLPLVLGGAVDALCRAMGGDGRPVGLLF